MKRIRPSFPAGVGLPALVCLLGFAITGKAQAQTVTVDAAMSNQTLEGWGTSLAWFANGTGGWTNNQKYQALMRDLFSPSQGLGLTYLRFNIGGGDDPKCGQPGHYVCIEYPHADPGYEPEPGVYDWNRDQNQRRVALSALGYGADLIEAISYSAPYWMTISGTSQGGVNGADNLAPQYYGSGPGTFADYLSTVSRHYAQLGITFHHIDPMNEPGQSWWVAGDGKQEGCGFDPSHQETMIQDMAASLASKKQVTRVAAMDENWEGPYVNYGADTATEFFDYDPTTKSQIDALNTHGYSSSVGSVTLATLGQNFGKRTTVSEWGSADLTGQDLSNQLLVDIYETRAVAWSIWQPDWPGLTTIDYSGQNYQLNEAYYVYGNYTKFVRPGYQFLAISDPNSLAAFSQRRGKLVIVSQNWTTSNRTVDYSLANFSKLGLEATVHRTSATENLALVGTVAISGGKFSYTLPPNSVTTFEISGVSYAPPAQVVDASAQGTGLNEFDYSGDWHQNWNYGWTNSPVEYSSNSTDSYYLFQFTGQQARVYGSLAPQNGILAFSVDGGGETYFDAYSAREEHGAFLFATPNLDYGPHTLKVRVTGLKHPYSRSFNISVSNIDVVAGGTSPGQGIYRIVSVANGQDLEVTGANQGDGAPLGMYDDIAGALNEHWNLLAVGDGSYRIVNVNSGLDLEVNGAATYNTALINQWQDSGSGATNEHWYVVPAVTGYRIVNVNSGLDMEIDGSNGNIDQYANYPGATNEEWTLIPVSN